MRNVERVHHVGRDFAFEGRLEWQAGDGGKSIAAIQLNFANPLRFRRGCFAEACAGR